VTRVKPNQDSRQTPLKTGTTHRCRRADILKQYFIPLVLRKSSALHSRSTEGTPSPKHRRWHAL